MTPALWSLFQTPDLSPLICSIVRAVKAEVIRTAVSMLGLYDRPLKFCPQIFRWNS